MFKWVLSRTSKLLGRNVNTTFFSAAYREIYKELVSQKKNETEASAIMKQLGLLAAQESANRQISMMKVFPGDPEKLLSYLDILCQTIFGIGFDDFKLVEQKKNSNQNNVYIYQLSHCPMCGGYGSDEEDNIKCEKIDSNKSKFASGLVGMLEQTLNFVLEIKNIDQRIIITETKCFCAGDDVMELNCEIIPLQDYTDSVVGEIETKSSSSVELDFDKIESFFNKPLEKIKEQISDIIENKMQMSSEELFDHFRNYEDDVVRIIGFFIIHLLNETGRLFEKAAENKSLSKIIGVIFNTLVELTNIYIPKEVIADYHKLFVELLKGLAPNEMIDSFNRFKVSEISSLFFEGMEKALNDLGIIIQVGNADINIWEELDNFNETEKSSSLISGVKSELDEEKRKNSEIRIKLVQEIFYVVNVIISIPSRLIISASHSTIKSAFTSSEDIFEMLKNHIENILNLMERMK